MSGSNGGLDVSIPLHAGQGVTPMQNPLQMAGQFAATQNALNTAKLYPLVQQQHELGVQQQQAVLDYTRNQQLLQKLNYGLGMTLRHLYKDDGTPTTGVSFKDIQTTLADAIGTGFIPAGDVAKLITTIPNGGEDPVANRKWVLQHAMANRAAAGQLEQAMGIANGSAATRDTGQGTQSGFVAGPGTSNPGAFIRQGEDTERYPSRSELAAQVDQPADAKTAAALGVPVGTILTSTMLARLRSQGAGHLAGPLGGTGDLPASLRNPARVNPEPPPATPSAAPPISAPAAPAVAQPPVSGMVPTGLGVAQTTAQAATAGTSAKAFDDIAEQGVKARSQAALLANMQNDAAQFITGPGADKIKQLQAVVQRLGLGQTFGINPEKLAAQESFDKIANQIADAQGAGSDARLAVNQAANPSSHLTPAGVDLILRQLLGNTDYMQARAKLAADHPDKTDRQGFEAKIASNLDPRAFQYARLTADQKATYLKSLKDVAAFKKSYIWGEKNGLIGNPNAP